MWSLFAAGFASRDAQAILRVLRNLRPLRLNSTKSTPLHAFEMKYHCNVLWIDQLRIDVSTLCLADLLLALPPLMILALYCDVPLPVSLVFGLDRNKIARPQPRLITADSASGLVTQSSAPACLKVIYNPGPLPPGLCRQRVLPLLLPLPPPQLRLRALQRRCLSRRRHSTCPRWTASAALAGPLCPLNSTSLTQEQPTTCWAGRRSSQKFGLCLLRRLW